MGSLGGDGSFFCIRGPSHCGTRRLQWTDLSSPSASIAQTLSPAGRTWRPPAPPGYKLTFQLVGGPHEGRRQWLDLWLTAKAMARSKALLATIGITTAQQPLQDQFVVDIRVVSRRGDDGEQRNEVRDFNVISGLPREKWELGDQGQQEVK